MNIHNILQEAYPGVFKIVATISGELAAAEAEAKKWNGRIIIETEAPSPLEAASAVPATPIAPPAPEGTPEAHVSPPEAHPGLVSRIVQDILHPSKLL